jgi:hypothetical protein
MAYHNNPRIVTDGLVLCLDANAKRSYSGSGSTWYDLCGNYDFTLVNSPSYSTHKGTPVFNFSGTNDRASYTGSLSHDIGSAATLIIVMASISNSNFGACSRLFDINDGSSSNIGYNTYFALASCDQTRYGLWYQSDPAGLYPTSSLKTTNDDFKMVAYQWTAGGTSYVYVNGTEESSYTGTASAFDYTEVGKMSIAENASGIENAYVRVALVQMYQRALSAAEISQNYNALKSRFGL